MARGLITSNVKVPLTNNQFDALVSLGYNCGSALRPGSQLVLDLNKGDYAAAAKDFLLYNKAHEFKPNKLVFSPGLAKRRQAEMEIFLKPDGPSTASPRPQPAVPSLNYHSYPVDYGFVRQPDPGHDDKVFDSTGTIQYALPDYIRYRDLMNDYNQKVKKYQSDPLWIIGLAGPPPQKPAPPQPIMPTSPPLLPKGNPGSFANLPPAMRPGAVASSGPSMPGPSVRSSVAGQSGWASLPELVNKSVPVPAIVHSADGSWSEPSSFRGPSYSSRDVGPLAASYIRTAGNPSPRQCGATVTYMMHRLGYAMGMTATSMRDAAINDPKLQVRPDKSGVFPNDTILYLYPRNGKVNDEEHTSQHWGVVYTALDGRQYLLESTTFHGSGGYHGYHIRRDRLVTNVLRAHDGKYVAYKMR